MAQPQRTQKSIAERFKGNLDYSTRSRIICVARSFWSRWCWYRRVIAAMAAWNFFGSEKFYSIRAVSTAAPAVRQPVKKCHVGGNTTEQTKVSFRRLALAGAHDDGRLRASNVTRVLTFTNRTWWRAIRAWRAITSTRAGDRCIRRRTATARSVAGMPISCRRR